MNRTRQSIDTTNSRLERLIGWIDRVLPFSARRPLDRIPSVKLKLSIVIGAAIGVTIVTLSIGYSLELPAVWGVAAAVIVATVLVQILARGLTAPLTEMMQAADNMADGNYDQRVTATAADEVGELARSFNAMAAHIADLERQRRDLIANVSHELRTPIAALHGNVENLLDDVVDDRAQTLATMLRQTGRLGRLVDQLMDLSRLEAGASPIRATRLDLIEVMEEVLAEARLQDPEAKIEVSAPQQLVMDGDPERLHQVMANLLDNAMRHSPEGEPIHLAIEAAGHQAVVIVEDGGPGIPAGELDRVFERFYRASPDRAAATGGSGLGLAISRWIVDLHGGSISAANADPSGCRITVHAPSADSTSALSLATTSRP